MENDNNILGSVELRQPDIRPRRWWSFGVADLLFLVLAIGMIQRSQDAMLDDPGLGWHLRNVDAMLEQGNWLTEDPFSFTNEGNQYYTNQWLGDIFLWAGWQWGGLEGVAVVTTLVLVFTFWLLFRFMIRDRVPIPLALVCTLAATLGTSLSWVARPNVFTIGFLMITAWVLERYHRGKISAKQTYWLLPLMVVWVNTHGGFLAGILTIGLSLVVELFIKWFAAHETKRKAAKGRVAHLKFLMTLAILCTFINPYGLNLYPWVFQLLGNDFFMNLNTEWQSPDFHAAGAFRFELLILIIPLLLAFATKRPSLIALSQTIFWLHYALNGQRYVALWVVVSMPMIARLIADLEIWDRLSNKVNVSDDIKQMISGKAKIGWLGPAMITIAMLVWARFENDYSRHNPQHIPVAALEHLLDHHQGEKIFHHYNWGGWLTWHGWPKLKNWIDDRNEVQGEKHTLQYLKLINAQADWKTTFEQHEVQIVCIPANCPLAHQLAKNQMWQEEYRDSQVVIFHRQEFVDENIANQ